MPIDIIPGEEWRPVVGHEGLYEVSDHGRVMSIRRTVTVYSARFAGPCTRRVEPRILKESLSGGYARLVLSRDRIKRGVAAHTLVLEAFVGPAPPNHETAHFDGDRGNNMLTNLRWATKADNAKDKIRHGTVIRGEKVKRATLTDHQAGEAKRRLRLGHRQVDIARDLGVTKFVIWSMSKGLCWTHVEAHS